MARRKKRPRWQLVLGGGAVLLGAGALWVCWGLPSRSEVAALARSRPQVTGVMRQREHEARRAGKRPGRVQHWVPLSRVSRHLILAVVTAEDDRFFRHEGIAWDAVREALASDLRRGRLARGGSTITQQLAKNLFFSTRRSPVRKARELIVVPWIEEELSKPRILELYLNVIEWGDGLYGCEAAARLYYGKPASEIRIEEAAGLAAMIPNPRRINPRVDPRRHDRATRRVLRLATRAAHVKRAIVGLGADPPPELTPLPPDPPGATPTLPGDPGATAADSALP